MQSPERGCCSAVRPVTRKGLTRCMPANDLNNPAPVRARTAYSLRWGNTSFRGLHISAVVAPCWHGDDHNEQLSDPGMRLHRSGMAVFTTSPSVLLLFRFAQSPA